MFRFEKSILINHPQQEVFDYVTDPANDSKWQSSVESSGWISKGPVGVGSTQRSVSKLLGRKIEADIEVMSYNPPNEARAKTISGPIPFEVTYKLESQENGTKLTLSGQAEIGGFFKLAEGLVGKQLEKQIEADLSALKVLLEAVPEETS